MEPCKEFLDKIPCSSEHVWNGDLRGCPVGPCIKCGLDIREWNQRMIAAVIALMAAGVPNCTTSQIRTGYMCKVNFDFELGQSSGGSVIYGSLEELKEKHTCFEECGIVEVEITLKSVIRETSTA